MPYIPTTQETLMTDRIIDPASPSRGPRDDPAWAAVISLSLGVFGLVTAEFLPVSLLTPISEDLGVSTGIAGQTITATAVIGAIAGPGVVIGKIGRASCRERVCPYV